MSQCHLIGTGRESLSVSNDLIWERGREENGLDVLRDESERKSVRQSMLEGIDILLDTDALIT